MGKLGFIEGVIDFLRCFGEGLKIALPIAIVLTPIIAFALHAIYYLLKKAVEIWERAVEVWGYPSFTNPLPAIVGVVTSIGVGILCALIVGCIAASVPLIGEAFDRLRDWITRKREKTC